MIRVDNLGKRYDERLIFDRFHLEVGRGETVAVVGESGCGKTTLLRILAGLEQEYEGCVYLKGRDMRGTAANERGTALVLQQPALWNHMTVEENILFSIPRRERKAAQGHIGHICRRLGIEEYRRRYPEHISGGQAKRVSLARALASGKEILLLDEPLTNLDSETKEKVLVYLEEEYLGNVTIVYVSHDEQEVSRLASKVIRLENIGGRME